MKLRATSWAAATALMVIAGAAHAALVKNGDGTTTDTSTNLIWLQNWSLTGKQDWASHKAWAENLNSAGSGDWDLPTVDEFLDLYVGCENPGGLAQFTNVRQEDLYWSDSQPSPGNRIVFRPFSGGLAGVGESLPLFMLWLCALAM